MHNKYKKIILIIFILFTAGCTKNTNNDENYNINYLQCNTDEDCVMADYQFNSCCSICSTPMNKKFITPQERWRKKNCKNFDLSQCVQAECSIPIEAYCENNECKIKYDLTWQ